MVDPFETSDGDFDLEAEEKEFENGTLSDNQEIQIVIETEEDDENNVEDGRSQNEEVTNVAIGKGRNNKRKKNRVMYSKEI